uniref:Uncharacterized protein n=1 Tax=Rhabditophanes sp. KR3021 TaxID=114890 RepID=A0AC35UB02_9BILA
MQIVCVLATTAFLFSTTLGQSTRENPNLKFLDTQYFDEYSNRPNSAFPGGSPQFDSNNNANNPNGVLTDDAQNALNYQRIQAAYALNPDPTAGQIFTNNIYGYNYAINNQPPTFNGNATLYLPPEQRNNRRKRNIIELRERSRNLRKKRQAITGSDTFQGTAYANQGFDYLSFTLTNHFVF